jgi:outer membrane protein assembly factor BamC
VPGGVARHQRHAVAPANQSAQPPGPQTAVAPNFPGRRAHRAPGQPALAGGQPPGRPTLGPVRDFWQENGFTLALDQSNIGIMETDWAENRAKIPQDFIRAPWARCSIRSTPPASATSSAPAGAHAPAAPRSTSATAACRRSSTAAPRTPPSGSRRAADPELEAEFLRRLMVKLGVSRGAGQGHGRRGTGSNVRRPRGQCGRRARGADRRRL